MNSSLDFIQKNNEILVCFKGSNCREPVGIIKQEEWPRPLGRSDYYSYFSLYFKGYKEWMLKAILEKMEELNGNIRPN